MYFDASISNSYESILQEEKVLKRRHCTANNAPCTTVVETKQVENVIFWKNKQKCFWKSKGLCNNKI